MKSPDQTPPIGACAIAFLVHLALAGNAAAVGPNNALNDTGIDWFASGDISSLASEPATHPGQDGSRGRDAAARAGALPKVGGGSKGFDFTKIANNGSVLPATAVLGNEPTDWACTYDNVTGLMWEVKVNNLADLRHRSYTYSWSDPDPTTNGGGVGSGSGGTCLNASYCGTYGYTQMVNAIGLCGHNDWRVPNVTELESLLDLGISLVGLPTIDALWFPNTLATNYWSATSYPYGVWDARYVSFSNGAIGISSKYSPYQVRLVRTGS